MTATKRLVGADLVAAANGREPTTQLMISCGYSKVAKAKDGTLRTQVQQKAFFKALLLANSVVPAPERHKSQPPERPRSYVARASKANGSVVISTGYIREIGGDRDSIVKIVPLTVEADGVAGLQLLLIDEEEAAVLKAAVEAAGSEDGDEDEDDEAESPVNSGLLSAAVAAANAPLPVAV